MNRQQTETKLTAKHPFVTGIPAARKMWPAEKRPLLTKSEGLPRLSILTEVDEGAESQNTEGL